MEWPEGDEAPRSVSAGDAQKAAGGAEAPRTDVIEEAREVAGG